MSDAVDRPGFPLSRVAEVLGLDAADAQLTLRDPERSRHAVREAVRAYLAADDDRRAGRPPSSPIAAHPDFPTGVGMALVGAAALWEATDVMPAIALRVAKDLHEDGDDALAASFIGVVQQTAVPGRDDAEAWAAQSLLVSVLQRSGRPLEADALARDLAAHAVPLDLWRDDDPRLPETSMDWHGGALVAGMPPRRDDRALSVETAEEHLQALLTQMLRDAEADEDDVPGPSAP